MKNVLRCTSVGCSTLSNLPRGLETKPVFDWDHEPLGTVLGSEHDPKTHDPTNLIIGLSTDARERLGTEKETITLPFDFVFGIRRDEVRLSRDASEIASNLEAEATDAKAEDREVLELKA